VDAMSTAPRRQGKLLIYFDKNGLGYILGDFFTDTSGHPAEPEGNSPNEKATSHLFFPTCF
jgi:hypothetical protein